MKVEVIVPNYDNDGANNAAVVEMTIRQVCAQFGGATVFQAKGYWVNDNGHLYEDQVSVVVSAAIEQAAALEVARDIARDILALTDQEAVFISVGDKAEIVK